MRSTANRIVLYQEALSKLDPSMPEIYLRLCIKKQHQLSSFPNLGICLSKYKSFKQVKDSDPNAGDGPTKQPVFDPNAGDVYGGCREIA